MLQQMYESNLLIYIMAGLCIIGIVTKLVAGAVYQSTVRASQNIGETTNQWLKQIILRFEAAYQLKINVNNVDKFVDKYVYRRKFLWIHLYTLENVSGQMLILSLMVGVIGAFLAYVAKCGQTAVLYTLATGVATAGMLMLFEVFVNNGQKKAIIKTNIEDYLENYLKVKLEYEVFAPDELEKYQREYFEDREAQAEKMREDADEEDIQTSENLGVNAAGAKVDEQDVAVAGMKRRHEKKKEKKTKPDMSTAAAKERIVTEILEEFLL